MSRFCNQCGKTLADGEVCTCALGAQPQYGQQAPPQGQYGQQMPPQQPYGQPAPQYAPPQGQYGQQVPPQAPYGQQVPPQAPYGQQMPPQGQYYAPMQPTAPAAPSVAGVYIKRLFSTLAHAFKVPAQALGGMTAAGDSAVAIGYIGMQGLAFAIFMSCFLGRINSMIFGASNTVSSMVNGAADIEDLITGGASNQIGAAASAAASMLEFSLIKIFLASLLTSVGMGFAFAGILMLFHVLIGKGGGGYKNMICAAGSRSLATVPFLLLGSLIMFLNIPLAFVCASLGLLLGIFFTGCSLDACGQPDKSKLAYAMFLSFFVFILASVLVFVVIAPTLLPSAMKLGLEAIKTAIRTAGGFAGALADMFD